MYCEFMDSKRNAEYILIILILKLNASTERWIAAMMCLRVTT